MKHHFAPGAATAEIGCGSGREVGWLNDNGYPAVGYDASSGLLQEAQARYPEYDFRITSLPALDSIPRHSYSNVLCEATIMHIPKIEVQSAVRSLLSLLQPEGTLRLGWRVTKGED